jgi:hypothetical protein
MTSISQLIRRATLTLVTLFALFVGVAGCPGTTLTISYSWPANSLVHIINSGVPGVKDILIDSPPTLLSAMKVGPKHS